MHSIVLSLGNHQDLDQVLTLLLYTSKLASFLTRLLIPSNWWLLKKVLLNLLLYILLLRIFHDQLVHKGRYQVLHLLLYILPVLGFYCLNFATV